MEIKDITIDMLQGALYTLNGTPSLIEDQEEIEEVELMFAEEVCDIIEVLPENDDFAEICVKLNLIPENKPKRVYIIDFGYNEERGAIAFADDWEPINGDIPADYDIFDAWGLID